MGFPRQEYWCGLPFPSSGNLPSPGIEPASPALQVDSLLSYQGSPKCLLHPWNSPGPNTGVGSLSLLQEIFPTQGLNQGLPHCRRILYQLSHQGPKNTGVGSLSLLQQIFPTQASNQGLWRGRWILYQLSYQGSPNRYNIKVKYMLLTLDGGEGNGTPLQYSCLENPIYGGTWWAVVHGIAKSQTQLSDSTFTFHFHTLEKEMATHSSVLAWRIPGTGEPGRLPSMGSHRVGHDWSDLAAAAAEY